MNDNQPPSNGLRLKTLLKEAGVKSTRLDASRRIAIYPGRTRDWSFVANLFNGWLHIEKLGEIGCGRPPSSRAAVRRSGAPLG